MSKSTNLFGTTPVNNNNKNTNTNKNTPKTVQQNQKNDLNVSLKIDPKEGNITGINVKGNLEQKDAYNFYQKNKQYMTSAQQMLSGATKTANFLNQVNNNNNNAGDNKTKKANSSTLANLFGSKK